MNVLLISASVNYLFKVILFFRRGLGNFPEPATETWTIGHDPEPP
jgi:hypothetical protein